MNTKKFMKSITPPIILAVFNRIKDRQNYPQLDKQTLLILRSFSGGEGG